MTPDEMSKLIAAVVTTLAERPAGQKVPASSIYLALGMDLLKYEQLRWVLIEMGLAGASSEQIWLTPKGKQLGDELNAELGEKGLI